MRPGRRVRIGVFAAVVAWHALVVMMLLRQRIVVPAPPETLVTTWLQLETTVRPAPEPPPTSRDAPSASARPRRTAPRTADLPPPADAADTAITAPSRIDWYAQASRAARDQYAHRLTVPRSLDDKPAAMTLPAPAPQAHQLGDQEALGQGEWKVWLGSGCYTIIRSEQPPRPGEFRPMAVTCPPAYPIDAAVLEGRQPEYLRHAPVTLPRRGRLPGQTRPGPSMGGTVGGP